GTGIKRGGDESRILAYKGTDRADDGHDAATAPVQISRWRPQGEKPGDSGRGDVNDDSGGAGRAPREEGAADARVGATTATAAGERVSNHSSRAWDGSRPADDTGR
ncbi:unnamed protein product, partial [Ascophyllum nodosum]